MTITPSKQAGISAFLAAASPPRYRDVSNKSFMVHLDYNDKETYLAWRRIWKLEYSRLSKEIRVRKNTIKAARTCSTGGLQTDLLFLRRQAQGMLQLLLAAKAEAWRQQQARIVELHFTHFKTGASK